MLTQAVAQVNEGTDGEAWRDDFDMLLTDENIDETALDDYFDQLSSIAQQHLSINAATYEQLQSLPFLSTQQIDAIGKHITQYGGIATAAELLTIAEIDRPTAARLQHVFNFESAAKSDTLRLADRIAMARQEAVATANLPFYTTYGDQKAFLGPRYKHSLRYTIEYSGHFYAGLVAAQDAGEPFFAGRNKWGYDHYSPFLVAYGKRFLSTIAIGNYRIGMGMGLVVNNSFSFGKSAWRQQAMATRQYIRAHSSRSASNYMQGVAAEMRLSSRLHLSMFASSRPIDATPTSDSTAISTILTTGYHRTSTEMSHKAYARMSALGWNLRFEGHGWHVGLTAVGTHLSKPLKPNTTAAYKKYSPEGNRFWNASVDYSLQGRRLSFAGETATGQCRGIATLNAISYQPATYLDLMLSLRHYSARYSSLLANAFGNQSSPQNETGALFGLSWYIDAQTTLNLYTDYAYSPRPRYGISVASSQWDNSLNLSRYIGKMLITAVYRLQLKQRDNDASTRLQNYTEQRFRLRVAPSRQHMWGWYVQADASQSSRKGTSRGLMLSAMTSVRPASWLKAKAIASWFHTDDYYSRLYAPDASLLYAMSVPMVYGRGVRGSLLVAASPLRHITLTARFNIVRYSDRQSIGSSYSRIDGNCKSSLDVQLVWRLPQSRAHR